MSTYPYDEADYYEKKLLIEYDYFYTKISTQ